MDKVTVRDLRNHGGRVLERAPWAQGGPGRRAGCGTLSESVRYERGVLDTSTLILLPRIHDPESLPVEPLSTAITLAELSVGPLLATSDEERAAPQAHSQQAEADIDPLPLDSSAARAFGRVAAALRHAGRKPAARASDALIAATALAHGLPVYTCNPADFSGIEGPAVVPVPIPSDQP